MIGAIIGDIVGSRFEWNNYRKKDFILFTEDCFATDDSIMSLAIAGAVLQHQTEAVDLSKAAVCWMQKVGRPYPHSAETFITGFTVTTPSPTTVSATGQPCESVLADYLPRHWKQRCR